MSSLDKQTYIYRYIYVCITTPCETFPCGKLTEKEKHHVWEYIFIGPLLYIRHMDK